VLAPDAELFPVVFVGPERGSGPGGFERSFGLGEQTGEQVTVRGILRDVRKGFLPVGRREKVHGTSISKFLSREKAPLLPSQTHSLRPELVSSNIRHCAQVRTIPMNCGNLLRRS
jgi:hypothetical protein